MLEKIVLSDFTEKMELIGGCKGRLKKAAAKAEGTAFSLRQFLAETERRTEQKKQEKMKAYEAYADGKIDREAFSALKEKTDAELECLRAEKEEAEQKLSDAETTARPSFSKLTEKAGEVLKAESITNEMLLYFIEKVVVYSGMRIEIQYRFADETEMILRQ